MTHKLFIVVVAATFSAGCANNTSQDLLWVGKRQVDIMGVLTSARQRELAARFNAALEMDPDWKTQVQNAPAGQALAYDPRCGLSKEEFDELLGFSQSMSTEKVGEGALSVISKGNQVYSLKGDDSLRHLSGIEIDFRRNVVQTSLGTTTEGQEVNSDGASILGAWQGTEWILERPASNLSDKITVRFALGRLAESGRGVMYYRVKFGERGGDTPILQMVTFDIPAK